MLLQGSLVPCVLLHYVDGELKDVAKGSIIEPKKRVSHTVEMDNSLFTVSIARVLPGFESLAPPFQPEDADGSQMGLGDCKTWTLLWPKSQIRVDDDTTPEKTPPLGPAPPCHLRTTTQVEPLALCQNKPEVRGLGNVVADDPIDQDFLNDYANDADTSMPDAEKKDRIVQCQKSLLFCSQETPPTTFTEPAKLDVLSPNTLVVTAKNAMREGKTPDYGNKRKRGNKKKCAPTFNSQPAPKNAPTKKGPSFNTQPAPNPFQDKIGCNVRTYHIPGEPILPSAMLKSLPANLSSLHDAVLTKEKDLLKSRNDPNYPVFSIKVPTDLGFVDTFPADVFFLRFDHIFDMFHMKTLDASLVRLYALHLANLIANDPNMHDVAVGDPYYMHAHQLVSIDGRLVMREYIEDFMVKHKAKKMMLLPYFPT